MVDVANHNLNPETIRSLSVQKELADVWQILDPHTETATLPSIEDAIEHVAKLGGSFRSVEVLVIGSFYLVGGALSILEGQSFSLASTSTI